VVEREGVGETFIFCLHSHRWVKKKVACIERKVTEVACFD
jgi:hypothetical protein